MKMTFRGPVFETNSSSEHTFIYCTKETFEAWKRGEKRLKDCCFDRVYREEDFIQRVKKVCVRYGWEGIYEDMFDYVSELSSDFVPAEEANEKYVDRKQKWDDEESMLFQRPYLDIRDNGKNVRIYIWGTGR